MEPLYITVDPVEYLSPGQEGARARVKIKHDARDRAKREGFDSITILDQRDVLCGLVEEVPTIRDIADKRHIDGYDITVATTTPGLSSDHPANLDRADRHGEVVASTNQSLTIRVSDATRLDKLKRDPDFHVIKIKPVQSTPN